MREDTKYIWMALAVVVASLILGISFIIGAVMLSKTIKNKEIIISDKSLNKITDAIQSLRQGQGAPVPKMPEPGEKKVEGVTAGSSLIKGNTNAKILLVEFSDFQCPFSKRFHSTTFLQIQKEIVTNLVDKLQVTLR